MTTDSQAAVPAIVVLVDETTAMQEAVRDGKKSRSEAVATAINSLLKQLAAGDTCSVALLAYTLSDGDKPRIVSRWAGDLKGEMLVSTDRYRDTPVIVDQRTRRIPDASGFGVEREETVEFPVWYQPHLADCDDSAVSWDASTFSKNRTQIVHVTSGGISALQAGNIIRDSTSHAASYLHIEISSSSGAPAICFPANADFLPEGDAKNSFERASQLSSATIAALRGRGLAVNTGARGLVLQGGLKELLDAFAAVRAWVTDSELASELPAESTLPVAPTGVATPLVMPSPPPPEATPSTTSKTDPEPLAESPSTEAETSAPVIHLEESVPAASTAPKVEQHSSTLAPEPEHSPPVRRGLIMLVLDRSLQDLVAPPTNDVFTRIKQQTNDILTEISKTADGWLDVGLVTYGRQPSGAVEVSTRFFGSLADHSIVTDRQLSAGVIRTESYEQHMPNGIGGIITVQRQRPMYVELPPTEQASCVDAFQAVAPLVGGWCSRNRGECVAPLIIHMTRGALSQRDLRAGLKKLKDVRSTGGSPLVHHLVLTESPGPAAAFPVDCNETGPSELRFFCQLSSPHVAAEYLATTHRQIQPDSRGIVINGTFDLAVAGFRHTLCDSTS